MSWKDEICLRKHFSILGWLCIEHNFVMKLIRGHKVLSRDFSLLFFAPKTLFMFYAKAFRNDSETKVSLVEFVFGSVSTEISLELPLTAFESLSTAFPTLILRELMLTRRRRNWVTAGFIRRMWRFITRRIKCWDGSDGNLMSMALWVIFFDERADPPTPWSCWFSLQTRLQSTNCGS